MVKIIINIFKRIMVLIILLFIASCSPGIIIHNMVSDTSLDKNLLSSLYTFNWESSPYFEIDGKEIEFHENSQMDLSTSFDRYLLAPGIHRINVSFSIESFSPYLVNHYIEFDAKSGKDYALSYIPGYFSNTRGDSITLNFDIDMPVIKEWKGARSYGEGEKLPLIDASFTEFKPTIIEDKILLLYSGEPLSPSQTAKLINNDEEGIHIECLSGQSGKTTIKCVPFFSELQLLPGQYEFEVIFEQNIPTGLLYSYETKILHLDAQAGHTYKINPNVEGRVWRPTIDEINTESP